MYVAVAFVNCHPANGLAAVDDLEDAVYLVECEGGSAPSQQPQPVSQPARARSTLDQLVEIFPQHDRAFLAAQLTAACM